MILTSPNGSNKSHNSSASTWASSWIASLPCHLSEFTSKSLLVDNFFDVIVSMGVSRRNGEWSTEFWLVEALPLRETVGESLTTWFVEVSSCWSAADDPSNVEGPSSWTAVESRGSVDAVGSTEHRSIRSAFGSTLWDDLSGIAGFDWVICLISTGTPHNFFLAKPSKTFKSMFLNCTVAVPEVSFSPKSIFTTCRR